MTAFSRCRFRLAAFRPARAFPFAMVLSVATTLLPYLVCSAATDMSAVLLLAGTPIYGWQRRKHRAMAGHA